MANKFDLIVFDWDGTLMDSTAQIATSLQAACRDLGVAVPEYRSATYVIGMGLLEALEHLAPGLAEHDYGQLLARYRHHFLSHDRQAQLFPGAKDLLESLRRRDFLLGIATGKARQGLKRMLDESGLRALFHSTRCADESFSKPHPQMLFDLMEALAVTPDRTLMIGDTTHDLLMAQNAGVAAVAICHGAHSTDELSTVPAIGTVNSLSELEDWLRCHA